MERRRWSEPPHHERQGSAFWPLPASGVAALFAIAEWAGRVSPGVGREPGLLLQLVLTLLAYGLVGVVVGAAVAIGARRSERMLAAGFSLSVASTLAFLSLLFSLSKTGLTAGGLTLGGAAALGVFTVARTLLDREPRALSTSVSWPLVGVGILALGLRHVPLAEIGSRSLIAVSVAGLTALLALRLPGSSSQRLAAVLVGGGLSFCLSPTLSAPQPRPPAGERVRPSVLLVTIDTLRADRLGCYGDILAQTPNLDHLASEAILFENAVTVSPWTGPSHASILTGLLPSKHGAFLNSQQVDPTVSSLAEILARSGFATAAFVSGPPLKSDNSGLDAGFDHYDDDLEGLRFLHSQVYRMSLLKRLQRLFLPPRPRDRYLGRSAEVATSRALDWLAAPAGLPFFLWVHYYDPHLPYEAPASYLPERARSYSGTADGRWYQLKVGQRAEIVQDPRNVEHMLDLYAAEISFTDSQFGRLLAAARQTVGDGDLWVVVTADHGESMGEHGIFFGRDLYEPTARVPLLVGPPSRSAVPTRRVSVQVSVVDLAATILDAVGLAPPGDSDGGSLLPLIEGTAKAAERSAFMVLDPHDDAVPPSISVRKDGWKLILRRPGWSGHRWLGSRGELYDLAADPKELRDLYDEQPARAAELQELLAGGELGSSRHDPDLPEDKLEMLRSLGYIN